MHRMLFPCVVLVLVYLILPSQACETSEFNNYVEQNFLQPTSGGKVVCDYVLFEDEYGEHINEVDVVAKTAKLFGWVICAEFNSEFKVEAGISTAVVFNLDCAHASERIADTGCGCELVGHTTPRPGTAHVESIHSLFPESLWNKLGGRPESLSSQKLAEQAKKLATKQEL